MEARIKPMQALVALATAFMVSGAMAQSFAKQLQGVFLADDDTYIESFRLGSTSVFDITTLSYAGGVADDGQVVNGGGFIPVLSLFSLNGDVLQIAQGGNAICGAGSHPDALSGFCWDASFSTQLAAGDYFFVLSQDGNVPGGAQYADGFTATGQNAYTGETYAGNPDSRFVSPDGSARSGAWFLQYSVSAVSSVPEASTAALLLCGLLALGRQRPGKQLQQNTQNSQEGLA
ncbi:MAG: DVUA0089 family protein [Aquabacterium commune]|uniref:DVUA0089 family protein n=2 Tax=Aquabacterium TaxID=92793 RepID=UPI003BB0D325